MTKTKKKKVFHEKVNFNFKQFTIEPVGDAIITIVVVVWETIFENVDIDCILETIFVTVSEADFVSEDNNEDVLMLSLLSIFLLVDDRLLVDDFEFIKFVDDFEFIIFVDNFVEDFVVVVDFELIVFVFVDVGEMLFVDDVVLPIVFVFNVVVWRTEFVGDAVDPLVVTRVVVRGNEAVEVVTAVCCVVVAEHLLGLSVQSHGNWQASKQLFSKLSEAYKSLFEWINVKNKIESWKSIEFTMPLWLWVLVQRVNYEINVWNK